MNSKTNKKNKKSEEKGGLLNDNQINASFIRKPPSGEKREENEFNLKFCEDWNCKEKGNVCFLIMLQFNIETTN